MFEAYRIKKSHLCNEMKSHTFICYYFLHLYVKPFYLLLPNLYIRFNHGGTKKRERKTKQKENKLSKTTVILQLVFSIRQS